jgi:hypothetical protein
MIQTPTSEIHLLLDSASIKNAKDFQILIQDQKDKSKDAELIPASNLIVSINNATLQYLVQHFF